MASHLKRDRTFTLSLSAKECVKVLKSAENFEFLTKIQVDGGYLPSILQQ
jgi:hypothetical protein